MHQPHAADGASARSRTACRVAVGAAVLVVLLASVGAPALDAGARWDAESYAGWPALGLSALLFGMAGERRRRSMLVLQTVGLGAVLTLTYDLAWWAGAAISLVVTVPALLSLHLLRPGTAAYRRFNEGEVDAYHGVTAGIGLLCASLSAAAVALTGPDGPMDVLLTCFTAFLAATTAQLVLLPFHLRRGGGWTLGTARLEIWAQRTVLALGLVVVFSPEATLPVTFLLFPILGWVALRGSATETHQQVLVVVVVAFAATLGGHGPMSLASLTGHASLAPMLLYLFIASVCCLLVPLALTVERLRAVSRAAVASASTVQRMLDSTSGTVFIATDLAGVVTHCNKGAETALGVSADALLGRLTHTLHSEAEVRRQARALGIDEATREHQALYNAATLAQTRAGVRRDWEFLRDDGGVRIVSLNISRLTEPGGAPVGFIASGEDVTERARAQSALEVAYQRERGSVAALREADEMKRKLVSVVSHELRTPITSIAGYTEALQEGAFGELTSSQAAAVRRIERNSTRLRQLVEDLLMLSQSESGPTPLAHEDVDLNDVVRAAHDMVQLQADGRRLETCLALHPGPVLVRGDRGLLERAVVGLWSNAVKFTPDGGTITVRTVAPGPRADAADVHDLHAQVVVADTGIGIADDDQPKVFSRFYRTAAAGDLAIQGSGLGLSVVETIVDQHAGTIDLRSAPGDGTVVTVSIPA